MCVSVCGAAEDQCRICMILTSSDNPSAIICGEGGGGIKTATFSNIKIVIVLVAAGVVRVVVVPRLAIMMRVA